MWTGSLFQRVPPIVKCWKRFKGGTRENTDYFDASKLVPSLVTLSWGLQCTEKSFVKPVHKPSFGSVLLEIDHKICYKSGSYNSYRGGTRIYCWGQREFGGPEGRAPSEADDLLLLQSWKKHLNNTRQKC